MDEVKYEYYPSFMSGAGEKDKDEPLSFWHVPSNVYALDNNMQAAMGIGFARQYLESINMDEEAGGCDNYLGWIVRDMGIELDSVKIGFFAELGRLLALVAEHEFGHLESKND
jgi:hypothetical protein